MGRPLGIQRGGVRWVRELTVAFPDERALVESIRE